MITHYGLFWSSSDVYWTGNRKYVSQLLGREKNRLKRRGRPTSEEMKNSSDYSDYIGIYCLYRNSKLIYVGEAGLNEEGKSTLFSRLKQHRSDNLSDRWDEFSWFGRLRDEILPETKACVALAQFEAILIAVTNPGFNKQSGTFSKAVQVFQVPHGKAEGDIDTKLGQLMKKLEDIEKVVKPKSEPKKRGRKPKPKSDFAD